MINHKDLILGTSLWGWTVKKKECFKILDIFYNNGYRWIDTATNYPINSDKKYFRYAENLIAEWIKNNDINDLKIISKIGSLNNLGGSNVNLSYSFILMNYEYYLDKFHSCLKNIMVHWDNRDSKLSIESTINALKIIDGGHIEGKNMMGSWAGAMGQPQFMPSSFLGYAQDYNNDGKKDIWTTKEDVLASAANYLSKLKWNKNQTWGREVSVTDEFNVDPSSLTLKHEKTLNDWQELGVRKLNGNNLPSSTKLKASLIVIDDKNSFRYFLAYENFKKILRWNTSNFFAIAVGKLSDSITVR